MQAGAPRLVGRTAELGELQEAVRAAGRGGPAAVVLSGEPGIGKSRLLAEFLHRARHDGATVLRGGCLDLGGGMLPYLPVIEMLRGLVRQRGAPAVRALVEAMLTDLALGGRCLLRELRPLTDDELAELVHDLVAGEPDDAVVQSVVERSGGNAFFARELVAAGDFGRAAVPVAVRDLLQVRLDAEGPQARHVAGVIAVAGRPIGHPLLAAASRLPRAELLPATRACVTTGLIVVDPTQEYRFRHALARDAVYSELLPGERADHHRALAVALAAAPQLGMAEATSSTAELAHHWSLADDVGRAFAASVAAAGAAMAAYGYAEAESQYERALRLWPVVEHPVESPPENATGDLLDLLTTAADACRWAGHVDRAVALIDQALGQARATAPRARLGPLHERRGRYLWELGRVEESLLSYAQGVADFADEPPSAAKAWVLAGHATALSMAGRLHDAVAQSDAALRVAASTEASGPAGRAMNTRGVVLAALGLPEEGIPLLQEAISVAESGASVEDVIRGYANLGYALEVGGRYEESVTATLQGVRRSREFGLGPTGGAVLLANAASVLTMLGRWDEAEEIAEAARTRGAPVGFDRYRQIVLAELDVGRGRFGAAADRLRLIGEDALGEPQLAAPVYAVRAEAQLWHAQPLSAIELVLRGLDVVVTGEDPGQILRLAALGLRALADAADLPADFPTGLVALDRATSVLAERVAAAAVTDKPTEEGIEPAPGLLPAAAAFLELCRAEQRRAAGTDRPAVWAAVAQRWERLPQPYLAAYARYRQGTSAVRRRDRATATAALATARRTAVELGAQPLLREIDFLARAARLSIDRLEDRPRAPAAPFGLTRREQEVLELVTGGSTNRQIARRLFITEKTAGVHVSNILAKLNVTNRGQAAAVARRAGIA